MSGDQQRMEELANTIHIGSDNEQWGAVNDARYELKEIIERNYDDSKSSENVSSNDDSKKS